MNMPRRDYQPHITDVQKLILLDFMENHKCMVTGLLTKSFGALDKKILSENLRDRLNSCGSGSPRNVQGWKKSWFAWKTLVKKKITAHAKSQQQTGGGRCWKYTLSPEERRVAILMGCNDEIYGLSNGLLQANQVETARITASPPSPNKSCSNFESENLTCNYILNAPVCHIKSEKEDSVSDEAETITHDSKNEHHSAENSENLTCNYILNAPVCHIKSEKEDSVSDEAETITDDSTNEHHPAENHEHPMDTLNTIDWKTELRSTGVAVDTLPSAEVAADILSSAEAATDSLPSAEERQAAALESLANTQKQMIALQERAVNAQEMFAMAFVKLTDDIRKYLEK